jgi:hypothetical protein
VASGAGYRLTGQGLRGIARGFRNPAKLPTQKILAPGQLTQVLLTAPGRFGIGDYRDSDNEGGPLGLANPVIGLIGDLGPVPLCRA